MSGPHCSFRFVYLKYIIVVMLKQIVLFYSFDIILINTVDDFGHLFDSKDDKRSLKFCLMNARSSIKDVAVSFGTVTA